MAQNEVEVILMRQLASYLAMPILLVDPKGDLLFFNEAAERILGKRFDETDEIRRGTWSATFKAAAEDGTPLPREKQVLYIATDKHQPAHDRFWIQGLDGISRKIEAVAFPLEGQGGRRLGAVGIFWEVKE
jgi:PAS domain-containing protein